MEIIFEELTHNNLQIAKQINRDDIPESFVINANEIMDITDYGVAHGCIGHAFLAKYNDHYVGLLLLGEALHWDSDPIEMREEPFYRLMGFVIDKQYRPKGLGGIILEKAIEQVYKDFGKRSIALGCHKDNIRAKAFYLRHGFKPTGVFEGNDEYLLRMI